ncbi:MAG: sigma-70 family RNA polymerase sigma factor [Myxococcota bacterium]
MSRDSQVPQLRLVEGVRGDAPRSPEEAFDRYARYVGAVALRLLGRSDEVDDVVQDTFVELVKRWDSVEDRASLRGWLATVATRIVSKRLKRVRFRSLFWVREEPDYEAIASPDASPEQRALIAQVYRELDRMPAELRVPWALRYVAGERMEDIATMTGTSLSTAKRRVADAQARIQRRVAKGETRRG